MNILSMSGFVPEQICDTMRFTKFDGRHKISHYCGYATDYISQVLEDDNIDGAVFPRSCDSCRVIPDYLSDCSKFIYQLNIPARQDSMAIDFFASNIKQYKEAVERHYGKVVEDIFERTVLINARNRKIMEWYAQLETFSYAEYIRLIHAMLQEPLDKQLVHDFDGTKKVVDGKAVYIVGSFLSNVNIVDTIESVGLKVLGDNLTESKRLFSAMPISSNENIYNSIAKSILCDKLSPTQNNFKKIISDDLEEIKRKKIKGVIFITQKYCEPYDYLFSTYKKVLDDNGIPVLRIALADTMDNKKSKLAFEAFRDVL